MAFGGAATAAVAVVVNWFFAFSNGGRARDSFHRPPSTPRPAPSHRTPSRVCVDGGRTDGRAVIFSLKGNGTFRRYYRDSYTNRAPYTVPQPRGTARAG